MQNENDVKISKEEFEIPKDVEFKLDEKQRKYYYDKENNKITLTKDGKIVESPDRNKVIFYHISKDEYFKHVVYLKDKEEDKEN